MQTERNEKDISYNQWHKKDQMGEKKNQWNQKLVLWKDFYNW